MNWIEADLENGSPWPLVGQTFGCVVVTNYLHRPLFPRLIDSVAADGVLLYETFSAGHEQFGRPSCADFLLDRGELFTAFASALTIAAFEEGEVAVPRAAVVQRIVAVGRSRAPAPLPPS